MIMQNRHNTRRELLMGRAKIQIFAYLCMYLSSPDAQTGIFIICPI
jgi:hypothetical protein